MKIAEAIKAVAKQCEDAYEAWARNEVHAVSLMCNFREAATKLRAIKITPEDRVVHPDAIALVMYVDGDEVKIDVMRPEGYDEDYEVDPKTSPEHMVLAAKVLHLIQTCIGGYTR